MSNTDGTGLKRASFSEKLKAYSTKMKANRKDGQERREMMAQYEEHKMKAKNQWKQGEEIHLQNQLSKKERQITKLKDELTYIRSKPLHEINHTITTIPGETPPAPIPTAPTPPPAQLPEPVVASVKELTIASAVDNIGAKVPVEGEEVAGPEPPPAPPAPQAEGRIAKLSRETGSNNSLASAEQVAPMRGILEEKPEEVEGFQGEPPLQQQQQQAGDFPPIQEEEASLQQLEGPQATKFKIPIHHGGK